MRYDTNRLQNAAFHGKDHGTGPGVHIQFVEDPQQVGFDRRFATATATGSVRHGTLYFCGGHLNANRASPAPAATQMPRTRNVSGRLYVLPGSTASKPAGRKTDLKALAVQRKGKKLVTDCSQSGSWENGKYTPDVKDRRSTGRTARVDALCAARKG